MIHGWVPKIVLMQWSDRGAGSMLKVATNAIERA
jgi:hypothetical protein